MENIEERDVILIGLGDFGERTINLFNDFLEERKYQLPREVLKKINVYPINFKSTKSFNYTELSRQIDELVQDSQAKKFNGKFSYIFIGDLYDPSTSTYAIDYAYLPSVIEQSGSLKKKDVLGFFTFADAYGATTSADNSAMASILRFFDRMHEIDKANKYEVPYKDPDGHDIANVASSKGPFDRNYIIVTPGNQDAVNRDTTQVFAERLFYEIFYISSLFDKDRSNTQVDETVGKLFSGFTMIQISRVEDLGRYFLKYTREDLISQYLLADVINDTEHDFYLNHFFKLIDIPTNREFPIDRAVNLFIKDNQNSLAQLLDVYQSKQNEDFRNYIDTCKKKIDSKLGPLEPKYIEFVRNEIDYMLNTLELGYQQLFNINRLTGNINTYILFIEKLSKVLTSWEDNLKKIIDDNTEFDMEKYYSDAELKIKKIQHNLIYKIPFFVPIRRKLIENIILNLPLEDYLKSIIKKSIAKEFLKEWTNKTSSSRNPVSDCDSLIESLKRMKSLLSNKRGQIQQKLKYISEISSYYYVIFQKEKTEYEDLLTQIRDEEFGTNKKTDLEKQAKEFFKDWTEQKNRQKITNSSEFIKHFDNFVDALTDVSGAAMSSLVNQEEQIIWAKDAIDSMDKRSEQLSNKSFKSDSEVVVNKSILLNPDRKTQDQLSEQIKEKLESSNEINKIDIPSEFTLGSVIYFQDNLWMTKENFQKYQNLLKYKDDIPPIPNYINFSDLNKKTITTVNKPTTTPVVEEKPVEIEEYPDESEMVMMDKIVRSVLLDYCEDWVAAYWYNKKFNVKVDVPNDGQIRKLSKAVELAEVLESLDDKALHDFAKELECPLSPDKDRQIELIVTFAKAQ